MPGKCLIVNDSNIFALDAKRTVGMRRGMWKLLSIYLAHDKGLALIILALQHTCAILRRSSYLARNRVSALILFTTKTQPFHCWTIARSLEMWEGDILDDSE